MGDEMSDAVYTTLTKRIAKMRAGGWGGFEIIDKRKAPIYLPIGICERIDVRPEYNCVEISDGHTSYRVELKCRYVYLIDGNIVLSEISEVN